MLAGEYSTSEHSNCSPWLAGWLHCRNEAACCATEWNALPASSVCAQLTFGPFFDLELEPEFFTGLAQLSGSLTSLCLAGISTADGEVHHLKLGLPTQLFADALSQLTGKCYLA